MYWYMEKPPPKSKLCLIVVRSKSATLLALRPLIYMYFVVAMYVELLCVLRKRANGVGGLICTCTVVTMRAQTRQAISFIRLFPAHLEVIE